jgi:prolyl 4-hydroxylase
MMFATKVYSLLYCIFVFVQQGAIVSAKNAQSMAFAAGGGGGFGGAASSSQQKRNNQPNTSSGKKTQKRKNALEEISKGMEKSNILDKWGLPPPTIEDIFPPLPPDTELIPATKDQYSFSEIQDALKDHLKLDLSHFDNQGIEKASISNGLSMKLNLLHVSPPVLSIENFFTADECVEIQNVLLENTEKKTVEVDSKTFELALSKRTSTSWFCYYDSVPVLLAKAKHVLGINIHHCEEPQIVRYQNGQEFSWHYDEVPQPQLDNGGQRLATLLVYLNTVEPRGGGGTIFRDLRDGRSASSNRPLTMRPKMGSALLFFPAYADGRPDDRTLHKGEVVAKNHEKRIIQMWIHESNYTAVLPPNNRQENAMRTVENRSQQLGYI